MKFKQKKKKKKDDFENIESKSERLISVHCSVQLFLGYPRGNITISKNDSLPKK